MNSNEENNSTCFWKRLSLVLGGLAIGGVGVAFSTAPRLGTSPISSLPFVCTSIVHWSFGTWTVITNMLFIMAQALILKRRFSWDRLLQLPAVCIFGFFIDLGMHLASQAVVESYAFRMLEQLLGCFMVAFGIVLQLLGSITYMPGDGLVKVISDECHCNYGYIKIAFDCTLVLSSLLLSLVFTHRIQGLREGTVVAAICIGYIIKLIMPSVKRIIGI